MDGVILISLRRRSGSQLGFENTEGITLEEEADFGKSKCLFTLSSSDTGRDQEGNNYRITSGYF